jgi:glycosyltransferase involved in cell wall biosynthesis
MWMRYSVIVPAYNEAQGIEYCITELLKNAQGAELIVVNDGSTDNTAHIVREIAKKHKNVKLVSYRQNRGKGYALRRGANIANGEIIVTFDADCAVGAREIEKFVRIVEKCENVFANGSRFLKPMEKYAMPFLHILGNKFFALALSFLLGQKITDALCGTRAFRIEHFKKMRLKEDSWPDFEMLAEASRLGLKIVDVPVYYRRRHYGRSKMKTVKHGFYFFTQLIKIAFSRFS